MPGQIIPRAQPVTLPQPSSLGIDPQFDRIHRKLTFLQDFQKETVKGTPSRPVLDLERLSLSSISRLPTWKIVWDQGESKPGWLDKRVGRQLPLHEQNALQLSMYMHLRCTFSCITLRGLISDILQDDHGFLRVEEYRVVPRPRLLLLNLDELHHYTHDVLKIHMRDGSVYVVDVTGPQFGYQRWFFHLDEYLKSFVDARHEHNSISTVDDEHENHDLQFLIHLAKVFRIQWQRTNLNDTWNTVEELSDEQWKELCDDFVVGWRGQVGMQHHLARVWNVRGAAFPRLAKQLVLEGKKWVWKYRD